MRSQFVVRSLILTLMLATLFALDGAAQIIALDDSYVASSAPTSNYGTLPNLVVIGPGVNSYIRFDLTTLPQGLTSSNISKATVRLYIDVDVTASVQAWQGQSSNYGIALVPSSGSSISVSFDSKENTSTSHDPELNVMLVSAGPQRPAGAPGAVGPQGPAGPAGPPGSPGAPGSVSPQGPIGPIGPQGLQGATGLTGQAGANGTGFNFRQAFDNSARYAVNDVVTYSSSTYVVTAANSRPNNPTPDTDPAAWSQMAQQSGPGAAGAQGPGGPAGPIGPTGPVGPIGPVLNGAGTGIQFGDGSFQNTAGSGNAQIIATTSPVVTPGYTPLSTGTVWTTGDAWSTMAPMPPMPTARSYLAAAG